MLLLLFVLVYLKGGFDFDFIFVSHGELKSFSFKSILCLCLKKEWSENSLFFLSFVTVLWDRRRINVFLFHYSLPRVRDSKYYWGGVDILKKISLFSFKLSPSLFFIFIFIFYLYILWLIIIISSSINYY